MCPTRGQWWGAVARPVVGMQVRSTKNSRVVSYQLSRESDDELLMLSSFPFAVDIVAPNKQSYSREHETTLEKLVRRSDASLTVFSSFVLCASFWIFASVRQ